MATATAPKLRPALKRSSPSLAVERGLWQSGHQVLVGMDEVGRGSWAGPLTIGAAVVPPDRRVYKVRDSKQLTEAEREALFERIGEWCTAWSVGHATVEECDALGMSAAQRLAADRALEALGLDAEPDKVLLDGNWDFVSRGTTIKLVKGDARCLSIAAASILAKVTRDRMMRAEAAHHPGYDFDLNKGYPCPRHKLALTAYGPTAIHRRSWVFMDNLPWNGCKRVVPIGGQLDLFGVTGDGAGDDLESSRADFEAKVRQTYAHRAAPKAGGKGSPAALLAIGILGTGSLALVAALLGGGLLYLPAAIPLVTVVAVLAARRLAAR